MAATPVDVFFHDTYYIVAHLHYVLFMSSLFGIFGAIALRCGFGHRERHPRTLLMPQLIEFILEALGAFRGDVFGAGRGGRTVS
jgi:heme/copper-type cytochrome/quinol oxidase subunit 1